MLDHKENNRDERPQSLPKRPASHALEALGEAYLRQIIPPQWTITRETPDYGIDFRVVIFLDDKPTQWFFNIQLKASQKSDASVRLKTSTLNYFLLNPQPTMLVLYDAGDERGYYLWMNQYISVLGTLEPTWRDRQGILVRFSDANTITDSFCGKVLKYFGLRDAIMSLHEAETELERIAHEVSFSAGRVRSHYANIFPCYVGKQYAEIYSYYKEYQIELQGAFSRVTTALETALRIMQKGETNVFKKMTELFNRIDNTFTRGSVDDFVQFCSRIDVENQQADGESCSSPAWLHFMTVLDAELAAVQMVPRRFIAQCYQERRDRSVELLEVCGLSEWLRSATSKEDKLV